MLARIGRWTFTHHWATLGIWVVALVVLFGVAGGLGAGFSQEMSIPESDSSDGFKVMEKHFDKNMAGLQSGTVVFTSDHGYDDPAVKAAMESYLAEIAKINGIAGVISPYSPMGLRQHSTSGSWNNKLAYAVVNVDKAVDQVKASEIAKEARSKLPKLEGLRIELGGSVFTEFEPPNSEMIGLAFAVVVLIIAFGSVLAMGLPVGIALAGVGSGSALVILLSHTMTVPEFATTVGAMIGLGVGIDYALFIVTRYREGMHQGLSPLDATVQAMDTAGRAVIFAGMTVVISLLGMLLIGLSFVSGLGVAASITVLVTVIASTTLLPALLGFAKERVEITRWRGLTAAGLFAVALLGVGLKIQPLTVGAPLAAVVLVAGFFVVPLKRQVPSRKPKARDQTTAYKWSRTIQAHPWISVLSGMVVLLVLAAPALSLRLGFSDDGNDPPSTSTRRAYDLLAEGFGPGSNGPFLIATEVNGPEDLATLQKLQQAVASTEDVAWVSPPFPNDAKNPAAVIMQVISKKAPQDEATERLVKHLRSDVIPPAVAGTELKPKVTGFTPVAIDFSTYLAGRMIAFFAAVLTLSFLLLMAVFRSLLVPLKAVIMNVLSLAAAYGIIVAIFQWGWGSELLGVSGAPIEPFLPIMMFAIVFGLSMDYEVFLLSRVKEEYDLTGNPQTSVADGLAATARVITAAAAIMVVVFGSFLMEENRIVKLFGMGLAIAVLLDATLVRMLLVPATMELLGHRNWWLPRWMDRMIPKISVEGHEAEPRGPEPERDEALVGTAG